MIRKIKYAKNLNDLICFFLNRANILRIFQRLKFTPVYCKVEGQQIPVDGDIEPSRSSGFDVAGPIINHCDVCKDIGANAVQLPHTPP